LINKLKILKTTENSQKFYRLTLYYFAKYKNRCNTRKKSEYKKNDTKLSF